MTVCTTEDDYTRERWLDSVRWTVLLSNGEQVIQDDNRPGVEPASAWLRLGQYVCEQGLVIEGLTLQFRSEPPVRLPERAEGYFFRKSLGAFLTSQATLGFYLVGHLEDGRVLVRRYKVPEMILVGLEARDPNDHETVGISLIRNFPKS